MFDFNGFVCGFRFSFFNEFFAVLRFWMIFSTILRFLIDPSASSSNLWNLFWNDTNLYMILLLSILLQEMICFLGEPWKKETET